MNCEAVGHLMGYIFSLNITMFNQLLIPKPNWKFQYIIYSFEFRETHEIQKLTSLIESAANNRGLTKNSESR